MLFIHPSSLQTTEVGINTSSVDWTMLRCLQRNVSEFDAQKQFVIPKGTLRVHTIRFYIFQHSKRLVDREDRYITLCSDDCYDTSANLSIIGQGSVTREGWRDLHYDNGPAASVPLANFHCTLSLRSLRKRFY